MEPPPHMIEYLLGPAMPYVPDHEMPGDRSPISPEEDWDLSFNNPKNRVDSSSLDEQESGWRLFRVDLVRRRLSAAPTFALGHSLRRIDIHLSAGIDLDNPAWRDQRPTLTKIVHMDGGCRDSLLGRHVVRALGYWSRSMDDFTQRYMELPFGSKIVIKTLKQDAEQSEIFFDAASSIESQWASVETLREAWDMPGGPWPPSIDISDLGLISELHESITLVSASGILPQNRYVLKSSISQPKYLYQEVKQLLSMEGHQNVMSKPLALVTKKVQFGNKRGVCGMLLPYYPEGTLAQALRPGSKVGSRADLETKFRWAYQTASALNHIQSSPVRYYSDLKLDNILLVDRNGRHDVVIIDFEQRGAWFSWSPPEINRIAHVVYLAESGGGWIPPPIRDKFRDICRAHLPAWQAPYQQRRPRYIDSELGYNVCWKTLSAVERERATSFMFGRVLWSIFEGQTSPNAAEFLGAEVFRETDHRHRFPATRQTPPEIGELIRRCTSGAPEWEGEVRCIERDGDAVYSRGRDIRGGGSAEDASSALRDWWLRYQMKAEEFVKRRSVGEESDDFVKAMKRPSMAEILKVLAQFGGKHGLLESVS